MKAGANAVTILALPVAILVLACLGILTDAGGAASRLRGFEFDVYQRAKPRVFQDVAVSSGHPVRILGADAASVARFGRWPWPRTVLARLTGELKREGAAVVAFDMSLDETDPEIRFAQSLPDTPELSDLKTQLSRLPSPDDALATAIAAVPTVTGFTLGEVGRTPSRIAEFNLAGASGQPTGIANYHSAAGALSRIAAASAGSGALNLPAGPDGEVRAVPMLFRLDGELVPALDAEVLRLLSGTSPLDLTVSDVGIPGLNAHSVVKSLNTGRYLSTLAPSGDLEVYFAGPRGERFVSAADLDLGRVAPGALKNAVVYISSPEESVATPLGPATRAEVRAEALENILLGQELKPATTSEAEIAFIAIVGAGLIFLFARGRVLWAALFAIAGITAAQAFAWVLFANSQMLLDAANPSLALAAALLGGVAARRFEVNKARSQLKLSFADSLPARTVSAIARSPSLLKLEGETRTVTCLSCHIRGFAQIAEGFSDDPAGFMRLINAVISPLIEDAVSHGGMIAQFDGEGFMACWNAPLDDAEHVIHACEAANRMTVSLAEVNEMLARERRLDGTAYEPVEIGIGISTGRAIAGGFTAHGRAVYSVTGDATVMADRIRGLSAQYGPAVIVGEDARKAAQRGFAFLEVDFIAAGPRDEPVKLYAMLGNPLVRASPKFRALETFHEHIFQSLRLQQWEKARGLIDQCRKLSGASQKIYDLHLARIAYFESNPPGAEWDGAFRPILK